MACEIVIPRLGWSMEEGTFVAWLRNDGDYIKPGQPLFELEGEKASQEIEAVDEGILRIAADGPKRGAVLKVGAVIGYLVAEGEPIPSAGAQLQPAAQPATQPSPSEWVQSALPPVAAPSVRRLARELDVGLSAVEGTGRRGRILPVDVQRAKASTAQNAAMPAQASLQNSSSAGKPFASPRARRVAAEFGIDWKQLTGSGAGGRIRERDVRVAAAAARESVPTRKTAGSRRIPLTSRRRTIAQRMVASCQQTVPVTLTAKADGTNLVNLRQQFQSVGGSALVPSYQDITVKLVAEVLKRHSLLAGRWEEDAIVIPSEDQLHVGIAVDTDDGLVVPVIRNVVSLTLSDVARQSRELIERARAGKLLAADMQGGVFTITNLGAFGIDAFTPVINAPEAAILGLGAIRREPIALGDGRVIAQHQFTLSLTFDHRILDGAPAARFLQDVVGAIANPSAWLLS